MIKKLLLSVVLVILVVFVFDIAIGKALRYFYFKERSGFNYRTTYSIDSTRANILIFGSSTANHHYMSQPFEDSLKMDFYNTGKDGAGIFYQTALLKCVLLRYTPKIIILDYSGDFSKSRKEYDQISSLLPYYNQHSEVREEVALRSTYEKIKLLSQIYPFNSQVLTIAIGDMEVNKSRNPDNKGYVPLGIVHPPTLQVNSKENIYEPDTNKVNEFKKFIDLTKASGTNLFVVCSPRYQKLACNQDVDICKEICNKEKVPFWDFSRDSFFLTRQYLFHDIRHLNDGGAKMFSNRIVDSIRLFMRTQPYL